MVMATALASSIASAQIPARLSDAEFWTLFSTFSEPGGTFTTQNFTSNEIAVGQVAAALRAASRTGGAYIGVGPEQNFTYIAALKPKIAFIIDVRRQNMIELLMYKALFEMSETRADFLSKLFARKRPEGLSDKSTASELFNAYRTLRPDDGLYQQNLQAVKDLLVKTRQFALRSTDLEGPSSIGYVYSVFVQAGPYLDYSTGGRGAGANNPTYADLMEIDDGTGVNRSFLATEENYRLIREMQRKNLIIPLVGDFAGPRTLRSVGQYVKDHDAVVTAFYLSNVEQYLFNEFKAADFYNNVATMPLDSSSTFIRTFSGGGGGGPFRFVTMLSPMTEFLAEFRAGNVSQYGNVRNLSRP
jgi:hypothetical protein